jgi:hypothetical protein
VPTAFQISSSPCRKFEIMRTSRNSFTHLKKSKKGTSMIIINRQALEESPPHLTHIHKNKQTYTHIHKQIKYQKKIFLQRKNIKRYVDATFYSFTIERNYCHKQS